MMTRKIIFSSLTFAIFSAHACESVLIDRISSDPLAAIHGLINPGGEFAGCVSKLVSDENMDKLRDGIEESGVVGVNVFMRKTKYSGRVEIVFSGRLDGYGSVISVEGDKCKEWTFGRRIVEGG